MKLSTDQIKDLLLEKFKDIDSKSLKRKTKSKTSLGIVRTFDSNIGSFSITTNKEDSEIIESTLERKSTPLLLTLKITNLQIISLL